MEEQEKLIAGENVWIDLETRDVMTEQEYNDRLEWFNSAKTSENDKMGTYYKFYWEKLSNN